jgi:capsular exopolysaccharide synthesis family protein
MAIAALYTFLKKPTYQSSMQLLVEPNYQGKQEATAPKQFADANVEIDNSTQLTQMRSSQLLQKAVDLLRPQYSTLDVEHLQKQLVLTQVEEDNVKTKVFQATYTDHDPVKTQSVLQAIQQVYQAYNREQQELRLTKGLAFINQQLPTVVNQVDGAEKALEQFRKSQNLVDPALQSEALINLLKTIQEEQQRNRAQVQEVQTRLSVLQQQLTRSPEQALTDARLSQSERYQSLLNEIQKTELLLAQQRVRFNDAAPTVQRLLEQQQRQQALLNDEVQRVLGDNSAPIATQGAALRREGQLGETHLTLVNQLAEAQSSLTALRARGQSLDQSEQAIVAELRQFPTMLSEFNRLQPKVKLNRDTLEQLSKARQELALEIARGGFDWQIVEQPKLGKHIGPKLHQNLLLAAIAGLILGCAVAFIRDGIDDAVHSPDDLKKLSALPLLGMIPELSRSSDVIAQFPQQPSGELVPPLTQVIPWTVFRESLDLIYKNIQLLPTGNGLKSIVVTSALSGEGKSTVALGLAMSAARLHQRVLLIDADLRRPSLHKQLDLPNEQGLSTLLAGETATSGWDGIQISQLYTEMPISVLTAGPTPTDPAKLLSSHRMSELITRFEQTYDLVVLDAPPVLGIVDAILTASFCSGIVLVGRIGQVTRAELTQATAVLNKLNVIGVIANGAHISKNPYFVYDKKSLVRC